MRKNFLCSPRDELPPDLPQVHLSNLPDDIDAIQDLPHKEGRQSHSATHEIKVCREAKENQSQTQQHRCHRQYQQLRANASSTSDGSVEAASDARVDVNGDADVPDPVVRVAGIFHPSLNRRAKDVGTDEARGDQPREGNGFSKVMVLETLICHKDEECPTDGS